MQSFHLCGTQQRENEDGGAGEGDAEKLTVMVCGGVAMGEAILLRPLPRPRSNLKQLLAATDP